MISQRPNVKPLAPGFLFISPSNFNLSAHAAAKQSGPVIMTDKGELVWNGPTVDPLTALNINDFRVQTLEGKPYLTYWEGFNTAGANIGHGYGNITFLDPSYKTVNVVCPKLGLQVTGPEVDHTCECDFHEQQITSKGTLINSFYNLTVQDLTGLGGLKTGYVFDSGFVDLDIKTGEVLFSWNSIDYVPISLSHFPLTAKLGIEAAPYDYFHINSVEHIEEFNAYLVSGRHTYTIYLIDDKTGAIIWQIHGDTGGDFGPLPDNGHFRWQHYVSAHNITKDSISLTMFNNYNSIVNNGTNGALETGGLELQLRLPPNKSQSPVVLEHLTVKSEPVFSESQGSYSLLPTADQDEPDMFKTQFMGYGQIPLLREYGPQSDGSDLRWEARFGVDNLVQSYRGFKQEWHGYPTQAPKLVVQTAKQSGCGSAQGFVSLNGATDVTAWVVYEGQNEKNLRKVGEVPFLGFETQFVVSNGARYVQVAAKEGGKECQKSAVVCVK